MSLASVSIVGNLVKAPEQMCFASGRIKTTMTVAINNKSKNTPSTDFYRVETWGKLAELTNKYLSKGNQVTVTGRLVMDHWTDRHGNNRMTPIVEATQVAFPPRMRVIGQDNDGASAGIENQEIVNPIGGELVMADDDDDDIEEEDDDDEDSGYYGSPNERSGYKSAPERKSKRAKVS